jgi:uncharacterized protein DUF5676
MTKLNPWKFGAVLSITVVISYILCALFWYSFPGPSMELLNGLFHGMDFRKIFSVTPFALGTFLFVLAVLAVWAYVLGAIYAVVRNLLLPGTAT